MDSGGGKSVPFYTSPKMRLRQKQETIILELVPLQLGQDGSEPPNETADRDKK